MTYKLVALVALVATILSPTAAVDGLGGSPSASSVDWCDRFPAWPGCP